MTLSPNDILLTGRVAVVTGAAVGIGRAIALAFAQFGAHVAICDRDAEHLDEVAAEISELGRTPVVGVLDVRDGDQVREFAGRTASALDHVDILVNNAGGGFASPFVDVNDKGQDALVRENFTSVTNFIRACVPLMPETGTASIINVTSIEAHRAAPEFAIYAAMKAAVANLTKSLALELGPRMIRVNCLAPDVISTPGLGNTDFGTRTPLPTRGHVDDCAGAAVFLASDLSRFVTGSTVHVDGGNLAAAGWRRADDGSFNTGA
jgi:NAD(P)-dependent dehydrogenase (short-subunit alcohol dehydrogenase family)